MLLQQDRGNNRHHQDVSSSDDLVKLAKQEAAQAQERLKVMIGKLFSNLVLDGRTRNVCSQMQFEGKKCLKDYILDY